MKSLNTTHKNIHYSFDLFERSQTILVTKNNKLTYKINSDGFCNCPGNVYHHRCWHVTMIPLLLKQPSSIDPWAEFAEEAQEMMNERNIRR